MENALEVKYGKYTIKFNQHSELWWAETAGERNISDAKLSEVKKKLDRVGEVKVEQLNVLYPHGSSYLPATITSYDGHQARISYSRKGENERSLVFQSAIVDDTEGNKRILLGIEPLQKQVTELENQILTMRRGLSRIQIETHYKNTQKLSRGEE